MIVTVVTVCLAASVPAALRWLRVAQREHYAPGRVTRFAGRWWAANPNPVLLAAGIGSVALSVLWPAAGFLACAAAALGPVGLSVKGVSSPLAWTNRMRRLGVIVGLIVAAIALGSLLAAWVPLAAAMALLLPLVVDASLVLTRPLEYRLSRRWVSQAQDRLRTTQPVVVAITGSYGKTTTKAYTAQLLASKYQVVASPASFNNELGLARALNEHLVPGTDVFVAEMGTYGPGELASLVTWMHPRVSVITGIGPVHLERFGSIERIVAAKAEILEGVQTAVLNVDAPELSELADRLEAAVIRCSASDPDADVYVGSTDQIVRMGGEQLGRLQGPAQFPGNLACAIGIGRALETPVDIGLLNEVTGPPHRQQLTTGQTGFDIIDDTYNANPAGAAAALALLEGREGRRVVITPGMVELGEQQDLANRQFARAAAAVATDVVIVGKTNQRSLTEGAAAEGVAVKLVNSRNEAVAWARANLGPGDTVLYENDLPDHYP